MIDSKVAILKKVLLNRINVQKVEEQREPELPLKTRINHNSGESFLDKLSNIFNPTTNEVSQPFDLVEEERNGEGRVVFENVFDYQEYSEVEDFSDVLYQSEESSFVNEEVNIFRIETLKIIDELQNLLSALQGLGLNKIV